MRRIHAGALPLLIGLLAGCDGGSASIEEPAPPARLAGVALDGSTRRLGVVTLDTQIDLVELPELRPNEPTTEVRASFEGFADPIPPRFLELLGTIVQSPPITGCRVERFDDTVDPWLVGATDAERELYAFEPGASSPLDAGEVLRVSTASGPWPDLVSDPRYVDPGRYGTGGEEARPGVPGEGAVIDIPGARFPAFTSVPLPTVPPITGVVLDGLVDDAFTPDTRLRWDANSVEPAGTISVTIAAGRLERLSGSADFEADALIRCDVPDTGSLRLDGEALALFTRDSVKTGRLSLERRAARAETNGETLLVLQAIAITDLDPL